MVTQFKLLYIDTMAPSWRRSENRGEVWHLVMDSASVGTEGIYIQKQSSLYNLFPVCATNSQRSSLGGSASPTLYGCIVA